MQFTKEIEENGKIPFVDCLITKYGRQLTGKLYILTDYLTNALTISYLTQSNDNTYSNETSTTY